MAKKNLFDLTSTADFVKLIQNPDQIIVLDFHAEWCGPCKKFGQFLNDLVVKENKYPSVMFVKVNIDEKDEENDLVFEDLIDKFKVTNIPRVIILKGSVVQQDIKGYNPTILVETLEKLITEKN